MYCRSPLPINQIHLGTTLAFAKATVAAKPNGEQLLPGQCAWFDRPIAANEPSKIRVARRFSQGEASGDLLAIENATYLAQVTVATQAALASGNILVFSAYIENGQLVLPLPAITVLPAPPRVNQ